MEDYVYRDGCRRQPNKECDLCEICFEEDYNQDYDYSNYDDYDNYDNYDDFDDYDYEPTDGEIEAYIERQFAEAEAKADNL